MTARELYQAGRLGDAVQALNAELRDNPADTKRRIFLFELLCFAGNFDRAEKQLEILAQEGPNAQLGALVYRSALQAERTRCEMFEKGGNALNPTGTSAPAPAGMLNGKPFQSIEDADPRLGAKLEVFAGGQYFWIPFGNLASIEMEPPKRLRDLLWAPAMMKMAPACRDKDLGEVLLPVLAPFSYQEEDDAVKLGRVTGWRQLESGDEAPVGQKIFLVDGEEVPFLEIRHIEFHTAESADQHVSA